MIGTLIDRLKIKIAEISSFTVALNTITLSLHTVKWRYFMNNYDNFFLPVTDLEKAREFYQKTLGLPVKFDFSEMGMTAFKVGNQEPAIILKRYKQISRCATNDLVCGR